MTWGRLMTRPTQSSRPASESKGNAATTLNNSGTKFQSEERLNNTPWAGLLEITVILGIVLHWGFMDIEASKWCLFSYFFSVFNSLVRTDSKG